MNNSSLQYEVSENSIKDVCNQENFELIQKKLKDVGVNIKLNGNNLTISIDDNIYEKIRKRNAGRRENLITRTSEKDSSPSYCTYADVLYMMQFYTNDKIAGMLNIGIATYYRKKKKLLQSAYYDNVDKNRLKDLEYLKSVPVNRFF